ncbi:MAG: hypothetical protein IPN78_14060, partial [Candidatus Accumulibacter sp.]|nr:hypothetical protein [Candidatus Accumulibacter propinquus]
TSLTGFEALLRGKSVTCYGQPFYSGWGLTVDVVPNPRRVRRLLLDELVAGALIEYPVYLSRQGVDLITPEQALDELLDGEPVAAGRYPGGVSVSGGFYAGWLEFDEVVGSRARFRVRARSEQLVPPGDAALSGANQHLRGDWQHGRR